MGQLLDTAVRLIPKPQDTDQIRYKDGDTSKIIEVVREADKIAANERLVKRFAPLLRGADDFKTCRNVWDFIRQQVPYVADEMGYERVRLPNAFMTRKDTAMAATAKPLLCWRVTYSVKTAYRPLFDL